jgi:hypothetical protein
MASADEAMSEPDAKDRLRAYVAERWAAVQPYDESHDRRFRDIPEPRLRLEAITGREAEWFLQAGMWHGLEWPLLSVEETNKHRSNRYPPNADGTRRGDVFFFHDGGVAPETLVRRAAVWRLHDEFGWPREHLVIESPDISDASKDDGRRFPRQAVDILLLEKPCSKLPSKMTKSAARACVVVEAKADKRELDKLIDEMRACQAGSHKQHNKCEALRVFQPELFLGVAAGEDWRLFPVIRRDGRVRLGKEPLPNLDRLYFRP